MQKLINDKIKEIIKEIIKTSYPNDYEAASFSERFKEEIKWFQSQNKLINDSETLAICKLLENTEYVLDKLD